MAMRAALLRGTRLIQIQDVPVPSILHPKDAVIKVTLTSICGTDMHPYRGELSDFLHNTIMGHEFTGIVESVGDEVKNIQVGDRVVVSDIVACGDCWYCQKDMHYHCKTASLFGYGEVVGEYFPGGQAEKVRVPYADKLLLKIPDNVSDENAIFVGDILSTGYACAVEGQIKEDDCVVVIGGGPVGLMTILCSKMFTKSKVFLIEPNENRHLIAKKLGAIPLKPNELDQIYDFTNQRGADVVLEAVGTDNTLQAALDLVRPKGNVVCVGAHHSKAMPFNTERSFAKELSLKFVVGDPLKYGELLLEKIKDGKLDPSVIISHRMSFENIETAYEMFESQKALKIVLSLGELRV
ncbi:alcohol dehydrogenase catalytic domain-containing protein [Bacillus toyonensis]|nr:hypothetical protein BK712_18840 [Bacillus thuringiensis serovar seoulensis]